jgi:hypothetical protein
MNWTNRSAVLRVVLLLAVGATLVVFGSQTSARSKSLQPISQEPETKQAKHDCDIDTNSKLEDCPADTIIDQYREKYDLTVVLRGGDYWQVVSGEYVNETYGYRVILPDGVEGLCTPAPMPWHGFFIDVANELRPPAEGEENRGGLSWANRNAEVYVEAHYNAVFYATAGDAANASLNYYKEKHPADLVILSHKRTTLRRLPAVRYVVQFVDADSGETMISEEIVAMREYDDMGIIYNIGLTTTAVRYSEDQKVLRQILKEWRTTRIE